VTERGRPKIGKIGIGFIAANEICEEMEILTTVKGSDELLRVTVDFRQMRKPQSERRENDGEVVKGDYHGTTEIAEIDDHYTYVFLKEIKGIAREMFSGVQFSWGVDGDGISLYGLKESSIAPILTKPTLKSWSQLDFYSQTMLEVGLNIPVRYAPSWAPAQYRHQLSTFVKQVENLDFDVIYDGTSLRKPTVLPSDNQETLLSTFAIDGKCIRAQGYLYARHGTFHPNEQNGVLIRIRNAAVGGYDSTFLEYPRSLSQLIQRWVTGEIWASDELEEALNIDRATLRVTHEAYAELQREFHKELARFLNETRQIVYSEPAAKRRSKNAELEAAKISDIVEKASQTLSPSARKKIAESWDTQSSSGPGENEVLRKYTVSEIYEIAIDVANEVLSKGEASRFIQALAQRLRS
jgi:hypothetical protein